jgi:predicted RNase H-like HicB family nuclease
MEKPFIVTSEGHRFKFTPEKTGYSVSEIGVRGVNTQGDTFEEALAMAHEASRMMAEFREELAAETAAEKKKTLNSARTPKGRARKRVLAKV